MKRLIPLLALLVLVMMGCEEQATLPTEAPSGDKRITPNTGKKGKGVPSDTDAALRDLMTQANASLAEQGASYRVAVAEWLAGPGSDEMGRTVFFNNRGNKQLTAHFVPGDPRRSWSSNNEITYLVDQSDGATASGLTSAQTEAAIDRAMDTWAAETCSELTLTKAADPEVDPDIIDFFEGFGPPPGSGFPFADIVHAGWTSVLPPPTLGVTITLIWVDSDGNPTDIDNNGKIDVAFREIYYSDQFAWQIDDNIDVETVALHEAGHGLSQAHFGGLFQTDKNGLFHFNPRALMNAGYTGVQQDLLGTDEGGHCSIWGSWPQN